MSITASTVREKWDQESSATHSPSSSIRVAWNQIASSTKEVRRRSVNMLPTPTADLKPKEKVKRLGWIHAFGMVSVFFVFLSSIYTSQEPYRFMSSNLALQKALLIDDLKQNKSLNANGIWRWLETVISQIGGHTVNIIEANCAHSEFKEQVVNIDGKDYNLLDPSRRTASCPEENMSHIDGAEEPTYLAGSHQLLSFGVFTKRSIPHKPVRGSVSSDSHLHEIPSDDIHSIDPAHDHKVAELCHVDVKPPSGDFNDTICILIDGFKDKIGTSVNWPGRVMKSPWDGHEYYAFESGSSATLFRHHHYQTVYPCYSFKNYTTSTGEEVSELVSGIPHFTGEVADMVPEHCAHAWMTPGEDSRSMCMKELAKDPTPRQAYVAAKGGHPGLVEFFDHHFGCEHVMNATHDELEHIFVEAEEPLEARLSYDNSNGMFFHSENQRTWIESSLIGRELLQLNEFIDAHTRVFEVFLVTRDLAVDSLFYSLLRIQFNLKADGSISFTFQSVFSPIMQYTYGMDGYVWFFREVMVCEIMFAILFAFFFYREVSQLVFGRIIPKIKSLKEPMHASVQPLSRDCKRDGSCDDPKDKTFDEEVNKYRTGKYTKHSADPVCPSNVSDEKSLVSKSEEGLELGYHCHSDHDSENGGDDDNDNDDDMLNFKPLDNQNETFTHAKKKKMKMKKNRIAWHRPKGQGDDDDLDLMGKIKKMEARKERSQRNLLDRLKSMNNSFKGVDLNNNGIDDVDEIKEILEDYLLPNAKGMGDILDWLTLITVAVFVFQRALYVNLALEIHDLFLHLKDDENFNHFMEDIVDDFEELDHIVDNIRIMALVIVIIGLLQFFRYLSFDRRFAIVTDTILGSTFDLIPVLAIFGVVCLSYAVMGTAIYGQDLIEFADIGSSLSSLFLMILGEFDGYYDMKAVAAPITVLYFWSFVIIAYFILFNMVLAVIFTVYDEEYGDLKKELKLEEAEAKRIAQLMAKDTKKVE